MTPYLISGPSVALICLETETEERMCNCSHIPWLSSAPVKFVLVGAPEHAVGFVTPLHARASCCGSDSYLPRMFPQQSWQLKTTEWTSWLLRIVTVLSKSSRSHSHISRNDNKQAPNIHTWCRFTGVKKDYFQRLITSMWLSLIRVSSVSWPIPFWLSFQS